jgi:glycoside/pentoside/hexuronide:cation symporter, GPH family
VSLSEARSGGAAAPLSTAVKVLYAGPTFPLAAMAVPVFVYMGKFYADVVMVPLGHLALAIALARAFDALTDPLMGWISDRTRTRWGRRRPYIALGAPLLGLAFLALFSPPATLSTELATLWFAVCFLAYFFCHTVFSIPYNALGPELSLDYHERSSLFGWRESFALIGTIIAAVAPGVFVIWLGSERAAFSAIGAFCAASLIVLGTSAAARLRERPAFSQRTSNPLVPGVRRALRNRPFRILLASYVVGSVTAAIPGTLLPFFIEYVIQPERLVLWTTLGIASHFVAALASIPFWIALSRRVGKRAAWLAAYAMAIVSLAAAFFLGKGDIAPGLVVFGWAGVAFGGQLLLTPSIQADVIDYDELLTGKRREAQYGALWTLFPKLVAIPGAAIPLAVLAGLGYEPKVEQSEEVIFALRALLGLVPAAFASLALLIAWRFPITEPVHRAIQGGIDRHARGEAAADPLTGRVVLPPGGGPVDENTGWLLDHFSPRELARAARHGPRRLRFDALRAAAGSLLACALAVAVALRSIGEPGSEPGALAVVAIAFAGVMLAGTAFHGIRTRVAWTADVSRVTESLVGAHLASQGNRSVRDGR